MTELKPCPFCGGRAGVRSKIFDDDDETLGYYVRCGTCWNRTHWWFSAEDAVEHWNRRIDG